MTEASISEIVWVSSPLSWIRTRLSAYQVSVLPTRQTENRHWRTDLKRPLSWGGCGMSSKYVGIRDYKYIYFDIL